jgi:hypothetical protein
MPLLWRLRLRNVVRLVIAQNALEMFDSDDMEHTSKASRNRARKKQPA